MIHPDFRMIVLANRPGFPFLGNDFFGTLGKNNNENNNKNNGTDSNNIVLVTMLKWLSLNATVSSSQPACESICYPHFREGESWIIREMLFFWSHLGENIRAWLHIKVSLIPEPVYSNSCTILCCLGPLRIKHKIRNGL